MKHIISFENKKNVEVGEGKLLSEELDIGSSPVLFGCRTGICGTCLVKVKNGSEHLNALTQEEKEVLELCSSDLKNDRLACQLRIKGNVNLEYLGK